MSIKKPQLIFLTIMLIGFGLYQFTKPQTLIRRSFSSQPVVSEYSAHGIIDRLIDLKIETSNLKSKDAAMKAEIMASLSLPFNFDDELHYKWTLGQNVILKEGDLEGTVGPGFQKDQVSKIKIIVQGFSAENLRHIGFEVWGKRNDRRLFADGLISSQKENSFEDIVQNVGRLKLKKTGAHK